MMRIYAIRHTSVAVDPGICYGKTDVPVSSSFETEKENIHRKINHVEFDKIYSSPLSRCRMLSESLFPGQVIIVDERLTELDFGDWEMKHWDEIYSDPQGKEWMEHYRELATKNGESYPGMTSRVFAFMEELKPLKAENIAVVAHAGVIRSIKSIIECRSIDKIFETFKPEYGSITEFEI